MKVQQIQNKNFQQEVREEGPVIPISDGLRRAWVSWARNTPTPEIINEIETRSDFHYRTDIAIQNILQEELDRRADEG